MYYTYVIENEKGRRYIGSCEDIVERLRRHNSNSVRSTKHKGPFRMVYKRAFTAKTEALRHENCLKSYKGNSVFQKLLENNIVPIV